AHAAVEVIAVQDVGFTAVAGFTVAIGESVGARHATARRTGARLIAAHVALAAVERRRKIGLAAVRGIAIAVGEPRFTDERADAGAVRAHAVRAAGATGGVLIEPGLAAVRGDVVAIAPARLAYDRAARSLARRRMVFGEVDSAAADDSEDDGEPNKRREDR